MEKKLIKPTEKNVKTIYLTECDYPFDVLDGKTPQQVVDHYQKVADHYAGRDITFEVNWNYENTSCAIIEKVVETDEEFQKRVDKYEKELALSRDKEYQEYVRLKKKFERC